MCSLCHTLMLLHHICQHWLDTALKMVERLSCVNNNKHKLSATVQTCHSLVPKNLSQRPRLVRIFVQQRQFSHRKPWHNSKGANSSKSHLFTDYATVADSIGVYTTGDYADIVQHLVRGVPAAASQVLMG